ncbi:uncharacterized protein LOC144715603 [Wolffia australiana]
MHPSPFRRSSPIIFHPHHHHHCASIPISTVIPNHLPPPSSSSPSLSIHPHFKGPDLPSTVIPHHRRRYHHHRHYHHHRRYASIPFQRSSPIIIITDVIHPSPFQRPRSPLNGHLPFPTAIIFHHIIIIITTIAIHPSFQRSRSSQNVHLPTLSSSSFKKSRPIKIEMGDRERHVFHVLEINLISAQDLKPPSKSAAAGRMRAYAVVWVDPGAKFRTQTDVAGGKSPTWNEKFLFRVPAAFLAADSASAVHVEIYVAGRIVDSQVGAVRFLVGNQRLLTRPIGESTFAAVGIRRPSGRFRGVLNVGSALLPGCHVSAAAQRALARTGGYRMLFPRPIKEPANKPNKEEEKWAGPNSGVDLCGLAFYKRSAGPTSR